MEGDSMLDDTETADVPTCDGSEFLNPKSVICLGCNRISKFINPNPLIYPG